jgi:hypothetical protein
MDLPEYVAQSTQASGVPLKVEEQQALLEVGRLIAIS